MDSTINLKTSIIISILIGMIISNAMIFERVTDDLNLIKHNVSDIHALVTVEESTVEYVERGDLCE